MDLRDVPSLSLWPLMALHEIALLQVSPDLYGDNNTRLFTYWTVR
jgi:hypothetical protein